MHMHTHAVSKAVLTWLHKPTTTLNNSHILQSSTSNLPTPNSSIITDYLAKELFLSRMWKYPLNTAPQGIYISPVGAIPKKHKPGKYRLIMDVSSPKNFSVNDGVDPALLSLSYVSINHLSSLILSLGEKLCS